MTTADLTDFRNFLYLAWKPRGWTPAPMQYEVAHWIQHCGDRGILSAFRVFGKTEILAAYVAFRLYHNPDLTVLIQSGKGKGAENIATTLKTTLFLNDWLAHLRPTTKNNALEFDVGCRSYRSKEPSVMSAGVMTQVTGAHFDLILPDDTETLENSKTPLRREIIIEKWGEYEDLLNPGGKIIGLGTPQTEDSIYFHFADRYNFVRVPATYPSLNNVSGMTNLAPFLKQRLEENPNLAGLATCPERANLEFLEEKKMRQGPRRYSLQMELDPTLANQDIYPLKINNLIVHEVLEDIAPKSIAWSSENVLQGYEIPSRNVKERLHGPAYVNPEYGDYSRTIAFIDTSGSGKDKTAIAVGKFINGYVYFPVVRGFEGDGTDSNLMFKVAQVIKDHKVKEVYVESNYGGSAWRKLFTPILYSVMDGQHCGIEDYQQNNRVHKEQRIIDTILPPLTSHRLIIDPSVARNVDFLYQFMKLTEDRNSLGSEGDDLIDSFASVIAILLKDMDIDVKTHLEREKLAQLEAMSREWHKSINTPTRVKFLVGCPKDYVSPRPRKNKWGSPRR